MCCVVTDARHNAKIIDKHFAVNSAVNSKYHFNVDFEEVGYRWVTETRLGITTTESNSYCFTSSIESLKLSK